MPNENGCTSFLPCKVHGDKTAYTVVAWAYLPCLTMIEGEGHAAGRGTGRGSLGGLDGIMGGGTDVGLGAAKQRGSKGTTGTKGQGRGSGR